MGWVLFCLLMHFSWACEPVRTLAPAYLALSESTGGPLFLFQQNEVHRSGAVVLSASTHPSTLYRAVGRMSGTRTFEFPVDSTVESMLVSASLECRESVRLLDPKLMESAGADLIAGRIVKLDRPS